MDRDKREVLFEGPGKRIEAYTLKVRGELRLCLQEWDIDAQGFTSFMLFQSWGPTVAREKYARATAAAIERFWNAHLPAAKALVAERAKMLTTVPAVEDLPDRETRFQRAALSIIDRQAKGGTP